MVINLRPIGCRGCPLDPIAEGFLSAPQLSRSHNGVALVGEALGADEALEGKPFVGKAGHRLNRLIEWAGFKREDFDIYNAVWCRPPRNLLEGQPFEKRAVSHCQNSHWGRLTSRSRVIVPLGNVATDTFLGRKGILSIRGYVWPGDGRHYLPTIHPSFIQRGQSRWSAAFINDLQKAVLLAREGLPPIVNDYLLDPLPYEALGWARAYLRALESDPSIRLAFDIETPGKDEDEEDLEVDSDAPDRTWRIDRIGFSYRPHSALSIPWEPAYMGVARILLGSTGDKVVWNAGFDVPRIRRANVEIAGTIHDGMVAWHILHSDLPKRLGFVATFTDPWRPAWKHLSHSRPAFYNGTDADVEGISMTVIETNLRRAGLWGVYQRDVLDLEPLLLHMHRKGMPIDADIRLDRAVKLAERLERTKRDMEEAVPLEARRIEHVYRKAPAITDGLLHRPGFAEIRVCSECGAEAPRKDHFKRYVKKINRCADARPVFERREVREYYRLSAFSPSRDQLIRYHLHLNRPLPLVYDKKTQKRRVSFGERQIKDLRAKFPLDPLYPLVLEYRSLDKVAGTYIGRPDVKEMDPR